MSSIHEIKKWQKSRDTAPLKLLAKFVFDGGKYNLNETGSEKAEKTL